jgi:hypothetical protein
MFPKTPQINMARIPTKERAKIGLKKIPRYVASSSIIAIVTRNQRASRLTMESICINQE